MVRVAPEDWPEAYGLKGTAIKPRQPQKQALQQCARGESEAITKLTNRLQTRAIPCRQPNLELTH